MKVIALLVFVAAIATRTAALYFYINEGKEKCFLDEVSKGQVVILHYELLENAQRHGHDKGVKLIAYDPDNNEIYSRNTQGKGKGTFTAQESGNYRICVSAPSTSWVKSNRLTYSLKINIGESDTDINELAKKEHLTSLQIAAKQIIEGTQEFISMQETNRAEEDRLAEENERVNDRIVFATVFQTILILASGLFQIFSLRRFFIEKKMV
eukprot:TRINITY_DN8324_c0_g5_i1.p1 TRINITY_DN8324_c0_g5~~TRINITY_DN8324_c0_g5_i1.p1  ORF type:complete len:210 (+),score=73.81 TRINITY_DN8324_c0_g5_i1:146-775(+)